MGNKGFYLVAVFYDFVPASIQAMTVCRSESLILGLGGIGISPHTPAPPLRTFVNNLSGAEGSFLYFFATA